MAVPWSSARASIGATFRRSWRSAWHRRPCPFTRRAGQRLEGGAPRERPHDPRAALHRGGRGDPREGRGRHLRRAGEGREAAVARGFAALGVTPVGRIVEQRRQLDAAVAELGERGRRPVSGSRLEAVSSAETAQRVQESQDCLALFAFQFGECVPAFSLPDVSKDDFGEIDASPSCP